MSTTLQQKEQTAQLAWTGFILAFFLIQAVIWTVAISFTANDRSHVVLTDFDQQSLHWDEKQALKRASAALGWHAELFVDSTADIVGNHAVTLKITDRDGGPIETGIIELTAFHCGAAADKQSVKLQRTAAGVYLGAVQVRKSGQWRFHGAARLGDKKFLMEIEKTIKVHQRLTNTGDQKPELQRV